MSDMVLTKSDLNQIEEIVDRKLEEKLEEKLDEKLEEKLDAFKDDLYRKIDPVLKAVLDDRDEREILTDRVGDHEERIGKLELAVSR